MVCQNCGSSDIISVQGQSYCINCGHQVVPEPTPAAPKAVEPDNVEKAAETALKIAEAAVAGKPTDPTATTEAPEPEPDAPPVATINYPKITKFSGAAISAEEAKTDRPLPQIPTEKGKIPKTSVKKREVPDLIIPQSPLPKPAPVTKSNTEAAKPLEPAQKRSMSDLRPKPGAPTEPPVLSAQAAMPSVAPPQTPTTSPVPKKTKIKSANMATLPDQPLGVGRAASAAFGSLNQKKLIGFGLLAATLNTLPSAFATQYKYAQLNGTFINQFLEFLSLNRTYAAISFSLTLTIIFLCYVLRRYAGGALIYGASKLHDRRGGGALYWSYAGWNSVPGLISLDILALFSILLVTTLATSILFAMSAFLLPIWVQAAIFGGIGTGVLVASLGILWARYLGQYAVILGSLSAPSATIFGWNQFRLHFLRLWGAAVVVMGINAAFLALHAASTWLITASASQFRADASGIAVTMLTAWVIGTVILGALAIANAVFGYHIYRHVTEATPYSHVLLAGRHVHKPHRFSSLVGAGVAVIAITAISSFAIFQQELVIMYAGILFQG